MSETDPDVTLDARRWARAKDWTWAEAEYLLVGLDYWKVSRLSPDVPLDLKDRERAKVRDALQFHFRLDEVPARVAPTVALEIASRAGIVPPEELALEVASAADRARTTARHSPEPDSSKGLARKYNKLLKVFLAIAVKGYGYDPLAHRQQAIAAIRLDAEAVGVRVDDDTIRSRLSEAREELDATEEFHLADYLENRRS